MFSWTDEELLRTSVGLIQPSNVRPATLISGFLRRFVDVAQHSSTLKHTLALFNTLFNISTRPSRTLLEPQLIYKYTEQEEEQTI